MIMTHGSLFSGIGGFDLAAEWAGWENQFHCEWNEFGQRVLNYYWPKAISYGDITKTDFTIWRGRIDVLSGGFPCQPYSLAGKRLGKEDDRHLWPEMLRAIREIQPKWVVGENVFGIINWNGGLVFNEVQTDLEAEGYEVQPYVLPAVSVNAPHRRDRVWFVAHRNLHGQHRSNGKHEKHPGKGGEYAQRNIEPICEQKNAGITSDSESERTGQNIGGIREGIRGINDGERTDSKITPNSNCWRWNERDKCKHNNNGKWAICENKSKDGDKIWCESWASRSYRFTPDTNNQRLLKQSGNAISNFKGQHSGIPKKSWFESFPTQPPIRGGDDGIPRELDSITFPKWRAESIKAYGNAIVPQVAYQIFEAINQFELK